MPEILAQKGQWTPAHRETIFTWANLVTLFRTIICMLCFSAAILNNRAELNFVGLGLYWSLDILDGWLARALNQETRIGAQLDILSDRLLVSFFYFNYLNLHPRSVIPIALFLLQFMLIDHYLSNQFMRWRALSPNYFYFINERVWQLNWSPIAKGINTGLVTLLLIFVPSLWIPTIVSLCLIAVKLYSVLLIWRIDNPESSWAAQLRSQDFDESPLPGTTVASQPTAQQQ